MAAILSPPQCVLLWWIYIYIYIKQPYKGFNIAKCLVEFNCGVNRKIAKSNLKYYKAYFTCYHMYGRKDRQAWFL